MKTLRCLALIGAALWGTASAQTISGSILARVIDPSGLPVVAADATLSNKLTGSKRTGVTDERGALVFSNLQPGTYELTVKAPGFRATERSGIPVSASESVALGDVRLEIGAVTDTVVVQAQTATVQTVTGERSGVITNKQVEELLVQGRNVMSLLGLLPGVVDTNDGATDSMVNNWSISANGGRYSTNGVALDGINIVSIQNNYNSTINVSMDAVAEVRVLLSNYQAEFGRNSGANVQIVSRSGGRAFHGMGSYFKRHEQFNANGFFNNSAGLPKPRYRFNTISYNLSGPIFFPGKFNTTKDKLFFFWSQEYWPTRVSRAIGQITVPTELERIGDFSSSKDTNGSAIKTVDPLNGQALPGGKVPASRLDQNGVALLSFFPLPNAADPRRQYNYIFQGDSATPTLAETLKLDYNVNSSNLIAFNYTHRDYTQKDLYDSNWPQLLKQKVNDGRVFISRYQHIFSPTLISELSTGFTYRPWRDDLYEDGVARNQRSAAKYNLKQLFPSANVLNFIPNATFGGVPSAAQLKLDGRYPNDYYEYALSVAQSVTKNAGPHTIKAGVYLDRTWMHTVYPVSFNGAFDFGRNTSNPLDSGYAYANAALGVFNSYAESSSRAAFGVHSTNLEWFVQDNWKLSRRFSLDAGVRFYWAPPSYRPDGQVSSFVPSLYSAKNAVRLIAPAMVGGKKVGIDPVTNTTFSSTLIGSLVPGTGDFSNGMVVPATTPDYPYGLLNNPGIRIAPRIGFSMDPLGKGNTVIRGGWGSFYNRERSDIVVSTYASQWPIINTPTVYYGSMSELAGLTRMYSPQAVSAMAREGALPLVMNFSFGVQHMAPGSTIVDASYVGSLGRHLMWSRNLNAIPLGANFLPANADPTNTKVPLSPNFLRQYAGYQNITMREWASSSNYHSLQVSANRRMGKTVQYGVAWTWSKSLGYADADGDEVSTLIPVRIWNYGLSNLDRAHIFKANFVWDLPQLGGFNRILRAAFGGWQTSGVISFVSGTPLGINMTTSAGTDFTGSPTQTARAVVVGDANLPKDQRTFSQNFNTAAFAMPAIGSFGNAARTVIRGPGINRWDTSLVRNFRIAEKFRTQLRWELYNAFNHTQFSNLDVTARFDPVGNQINARFGAFTAARNPRQMQLALRVSF